MTGYKEIDDLVEKVYQNEGMALKVLLNRLYEGSLSVNVEEAIRLIEVEMKLPKYTTLEEEWDATFSEMKLEVPEEGDEVLFWDEKDKLHVGKVKYIEFDCGSLYEPPTTHCDIELDDGTVKGCEDGFFLKRKVA